MEETLKAPGLLLRPSNQTLDGDQEPSGSSGGASEVLCRDGEPAGRTTTSAFEVHRPLWVKAREQDHSFPAVKHGGGNIMLLSSC